MILYFSASGNSEAVARRLGILLDEKVFSILDQSPSHIVIEGESFGLVFPIYSWGVPPIVTDYIGHLNSEAIKTLKSKPIWMVCTCGDDVAMAPEMLKKALATAGLCLSGGWSLQMPNTYVLLPGFDVDSKEIEDRKLKSSQARMIELAEKIANEKWEEEY
ncbi:MAG: flavodoxin domain-containing protein, partial [Muribaculaceae bacterium]|nr:flavodoxin domain-containing protein [Muribaculaceae bacterium]